MIFKKKKRKRLSKTNKQKKSQKPQTLELLCTYETAGISYNCACVFCFKQREVLPRGELHAAAEKLRLAGENQSAGEEPDQPLGAAAACHHRTAVQESVYNTDMHTR